MTMPSDIDAELSRLFDLAIVANREGRYADAETAVLRILSDLPNAADPNALLGSIGIATGRLKLAEDAILKCLEVSPDHLIALNNLGRLRRRQDNLSEAVTMFRRASKLSPGNVEVRRNLLDTLCAAGAWSDAVKLADSMARRGTNDTQTLLISAKAYQGSGRISDAIRSAKSVYELSGEATGLAVLANAYAVLGETHKVRDTLEKAFTESNDGEIGSRWLMSLQYDDRATSMDVHAATQKVAAVWMDGARNKFIETMSKPSQPLNVGILSADFRQCSMRYLGWPVLSNLPKEHQWHFFSMVEHWDNVTREFEALDVQWHNIAWLNDDLAAKAIVNAGIDVLIDINGHTRGGRPGILARKPALIQVSWLDYPGSTGLPTIDWIFADSWHVPETETFYSERIYRLPNNLFRYVAPDPAPEPNLPSLSTDTITFGVTNQPIKATPLSLDMWSEILKQVPNSSLYLSFSDFRYIETQKKFIADFADRGIEKERLRFGTGARTPQKFLAEYQKIDISLDTAPYTGGLTTLDAIFMGVPVVTLEGDRFCSRHAAAHLRNINRGQWIAHNFDEYISIAIGLAENPSVLNFERKNLRTELIASPLMDGRGLAIELSQAIREIWDERQSC